MNLRHIIFGLLTDAHDALRSFAVFSRQNPPKAVLSAFTIVLYTVGFAGIPAAIIYAFTTPRQHRIISTTLCILFAVTLVFYIRLLIIAPTPPPHE